MLLWVAEMWWVAPAAAGAAGGGWLGVRGHRRRQARRLELTAAKHDVIAARDTVRRSRAAEMLARAEESRTASGNASRTDVAVARHALTHAQENLRTARATLRARRTAVRAARAGIPRPNAGRDAFPLARLIDRHNDLAARWMTYETDIDAAMKYPQMTDPRAPLTAAFLKAFSAAQRLRPSAADARITPQEFSAYRAAVDRAGAALEAAERDARVDPRAPGDASSARGRWSDLADAGRNTGREAASVAQQALISAADRAVRAAERALRDRRRDG